MGKTNKHLIKNIEFEEQEVNSYDTILEEYKDEINTEEGFNKTLSLLKRKQIENENINNFINFSLTILAIFIAVSLNYAKGEYLLWLIGTMIALYIIKFLFDCIKIGPSANKFNIDNKIIILEQNKDVILNKQSKTWDEL